MQIEGIGLAPALLFEQFRWQRVAAGWLMSPAEVEAAVAARANVREELSGWFVCGSITKGMLAAAEARGGRIDHAGSLIESPSGRSYLVAVQQAGNWQHRFVIPLVGTAAGEPHRRPRASTAAHLACPSRRQGRDGVKR
jgi:hypothetical protein